MCRRWRQLALQLPARLSIDFCAAHDLELSLSNEEFTAALERLLPHLSCRRIASLKVAGCTSLLAPQVPAHLARVLYPELRRWVLGCRSTRLLGFQLTAALIGSHMFCWHALQHT